jgi:hypothetical protein
MSLETERFVRRYRYRRAGGKPSLGRAPVGRPPELLWLILIHHVEKLQHVRTIRLRAEGLR